MDAAGHTVTHELGHYLAETQHLLSSFNRARSHVCPYRFAEDSGLSEDLAASFEIFVFESIGRPVIEAGQPLAVDQSCQVFCAQFVH